MPFPPRPGPLQQTARMRMPKDRLQMVREQLDLRNQQPAAKQGPAPAPTAATAPKLPTMTQAPKVQAPQMARQPATQKMSMGGPAWSPPAPALKGPSLPPAPPKVSAPGIPPVLQAPASDSGSRNPHDPHPDAKRPRVGSTQPGDTGYDPVNDATTEEHAAATDDREHDEMIYDAIEQYLRNGGKADTAESEALIRQIMDDQLGESLVNSRARMGRAGISGGGQMALEGDIMADARQRATGEILDLRDSEGDEAFDQFADSVGMSQDERDLARQEDADKRQLAVLEAWLKGMDDSGGGDEGGFDPTEENAVGHAGQAFAEGVANALGVPPEDMHIVDAGDVPAGATQVPGTGLPGSGYIVYSDGSNFYLVRT